MAFNPPANPTAGSQYTYGNVTWEFDGDFGVWNITDGTIVGGLGPPGPPGPPGSPGPTGTTGIEGASSEIRLATTSLTGVASFNPSQFQVSATGNVRFSGSTGDQIQAGSYMLVTGTKVKTITNHGVHTVNGVTGPITISVLSGLSLSQTPQVGGGADILLSNDLYNNVVTSLNGEQGVITTGPTGSVAYRHGSTGRLTGSSEFLYGGGGNGGGLTFTSEKINISNSSLSMSVTGPNIIIGQSTQVTGGVFTNPAEKSVKYTLASGVNDIVINGLSGTIQRYFIDPNGTITVKCGSSWRNVAGDTETIAVMVHSLKGHTGLFDGNIISGNPILFGVTGGLEMFTIMRVSIDGTNGLTMGLQVANGLTGKNFNF